MGSVGSRVATDTIAYEWFCDLRARLEALDVIVRVNRVPAIVPLFVFVVELLDGAEPQRAAAGGAGAHEQVEPALRGAVLEAVQSRLTMIAGARDDLPLATTPPPLRALGLGFPTPAFLAEQPLAGDDTDPLDDATAVRRIVRQLMAAGYRQIGRVTVSPPGSDAITVKLIVPGLGDLERARRDPDRCIS
jgi:ribosomal protein S12 methylthiotransferase accessory factor